MNKSILWIMATVLAFTAFPLFAQDQENPTPNQPNSSYVPNSLTKALRKLQNDQRFQKLRAERIELLESIPKGRAQIQSLEAQLAEMESKIVALQEMIKSSESGLESEKLTEQRDRLRSIEAAKESELSRVESLKERHSDVLTSLAVKNEKIVDLEQSLTRAREDLQDATKALNAALATERRLVTSIDAKRLHLKGMVEILEKEFEETYSEDVSKDLSAKRRELLSIEAEYHQSEMVEARNQTESAENLRNTLTDTEKKLAASLGDERERAAELELELRELSERMDSNVGDLFQIDAEIERMTKAIERCLAPCFRTTDLRFL